MTQKMSCAESFRTHRSKPSIAVFLHKTLILIGTVPDPFPPSSRLFEIQLGQTKQLNACIAHNAITDVPFVKEAGVRDLEPTLFADFRVTFALRAGTTSSPGV